MTRPRGLVAALAVATLLGCAAPGSEPTPAAPTSTAPRSTAPPPAQPTTQPSATPAPRPVVRRLRGIDVSHHQGGIDWDRVADDGVAFAYLKATEGSGFTDPRFAQNWTAAAAAGLRVGGYHYFTLCSPPEPQAAHFAATLAGVPAVRRPLPPVVDLELIGNCDPPPDAASLRAAVETFLADVEQRTGRRVVVYTHPDFDARYDFVDDLGRRRWVRRPGTVAPPGDWLLWQRSDDARVDGIDGPVDLDILREQVDKQP